MDLLSSQRNAKFTCNKFAQFTLRKIIKIVATRCQIFRLKCTKFDFGWGSAPDPAQGSIPDPAGGALQRSPDPMAGFKGATSKEGREGEREGRERRREGRHGKGKGKRLSLIHI